jgi:thymidylate kinase
MRVIIFEGVATSGKSTVTDQLVKALPNSLSVSVKDESVTHIPIMKKTNDTNLDFFKKLVTETIREHKDVVIFDRLYLTQVFRSNKTINDYSLIESMLLPLKPITVFLKVDEDALAERVSKAIAHRDPSWGEYVYTKGKTIDEVASYYVNQQKSQQELLKQSKLPFRVFDTTNHDYQSVVSYLVNFLGVNNT